MGEVIDLCCSDEEEQRPQERQGRPAQRQRGSSGELTHWQAASGQDDEVEIVEEPSPRHQQQQQQQPEQLDADLAVLAVSGDVWNRTLPHTRNLCGEHPFTKGTSASNEVACNKRAFESLAGRVRLPGSVGKARKHSPPIPRIQPYQLGGKPKPKAAGRPCRMTVIPDPSADRDMMLVARVELMVKAVSGNTIAGLRERLEPTGYYVPPDPTTDYGDKLCIDNLFEKKWDHVSASYAEANLKFKKMPLGEAPPQTGNLRRRQVTIIHFDGREKPTTYGVEVDKEASLKDIMAAAAPLAGLDPDSERFVAGNLRDGALHVAFLQDSFKVTDRESKNLRLALWRVPKPSEKGEQGPNYAIVFHRKPTGQDYPQWDGVGLPTLLPLGKTFANGGKTAEKAMVERLLEALRPLRRQEEGGQALPSVREEARRLLDDGLHLLRSSTYNVSYSYMADRDTEFGTSRAYSSALRYGETFFRDGRIYLRVDWTSQQAERFDQAAWLTPAVHESASPEAMQPTLDIIKANDEWAAKKARAKQLPWTMLDELKAATRAQEPGVQYPAYRRFAAEPLARVVVDLVPATTSASEKKGTVVFEVYVWKGDRGPPHRKWFLAPDAWESGRGARQVFSELGTNPLKAMMDVLLWSDAEHARMKARINEWSEKEAASERSIPGLMAALERGEMPAAAQPPGLTVQMRPYQLQSLQFMLDCECGEGGFRRLFWQRMTTPNGTRYWWSHLLGRAALDVPAQGWGGWCAEEMGLGKTVEVLGLILANPAPPPVQGEPRIQKNAQGLIKSRATLVVCAVSLVGQWIAEAQAKLNGSLRMHMYHGQNRIRDPNRLATDFDLVVTTYATLGADYGGKRNGGTRANFPPLGAIEWHRVVLDEAHTVKNAAVGHSKACMALVSQRRWMCTGTPINTDVADLFGQFCVLGLAPFNNKTFFDAHVKHAYGSSAYAGGCPALMVTLGATMVRHTKRQVLGGEEVLQLPPKTEELVEVVLTAEEQEAYKKAHEASKALFAQYRGLGNAQINKHLLQIMALLLPMRRVCSGGVLKPRDLTVNDPMFGAGAALRRRRLAADGAGGMAPMDHSLVAPDEECSICLDVLENPTVTACMHWFCRECILGVLGMNAKCPLCRRELAMNQLRQGITAAEADEEEAAAEAAAAAAAAAAAGEQRKGDGEAAAEGREGGDEQPPAEQAFVSESKLQALLKELRAMRRADPTAKALIFSQYVSTIEWLKTRLTAAGFGYRFISGSMPLKQRAKAIQQFQGDPPTTVFLLSMRSGSVGINLTAASHIFLMEPALNPALEEQAIGRAWRMGQKREVTVKKFYVKGSVEERIMEVVKQRQEAVGGAGGAAAAAAAGEDVELEGLPGRRGRGGERTNVRVQDLVGSIHADRQQLRVSELEVLFQPPAVAALAAASGSGAGITPRVRGPMRGRGAVHPNLVALTAHHATPGTGGAAAAAAAAGGGAAGARSPTVVRLRIGGAGGSPAQQQQ
ncbi:hypothetical protein COHA_003176 [Chlorella ohadii]|uniref:SNF2 super family n=1 Tax=Chlorella ohadii TaxID=2649997 RepID=A0AAD5DVJ4_9CHLO|nr:hypothetical protein COHA_003176 [Chlorella ohadii]